MRWATLKLTLVQKRFLKLCSKGLTSTRQRYSTIELECLAIVWVTLKCSFYLCGLPLFTIYTDHHPLQDVFYTLWFPYATCRIGSVLLRSKDYLICVDHWSGYPFYHLLCSLMLCFRLGPTPLLSFLHVMLSLPFACLLSSYSKVQ